MTCCHSPFFSQLVHDYDRQTRVIAEASSCSSAIVGGVVNSMAATGAREPNGGVASGDGGAGGVLAGDVPVPEVASP